MSDRYSKGLTEHYRQVSEVEISHPAEEILRFLSEQKKPQYEAHEKANFFVFNRLKFDGIKGERKLKGIFGNAFTGDKKKKYSVEETVKNFKAFVFMRTPVVCNNFYFLIFIKFGRIFIIKDIYITPSKNN